MGGWIADRVGRWWSSARFRRCHRAGCNSRWPSRQKHRLVLRLACSSTHSFAEWLVRRLFRDRAAALYAGSGRCFHEIRDHCLRSEEHIPVRLHDGFGWVGARSFRHGLDAAFRGHSSRSFASSSTFAVLQRLHVPSACKGLNERSSCPDWNNRAPLFFIERERFSRSAIRPPKKLLLSPSAGARLDHADCVLPSLINIAGVLGSVSHFVLRSFP